MAPRVFAASSICSLGNVELYADDHVGLFDDVIGRLIVDMERAPLVELSNRLAPVAKAPVAEGRRHAGAASRARDLRPGPGPQARALPDHDLVEITSREQTNLDALTKIAARAHLSEADHRCAVENRQYGHPLGRVRRQRQRAHIGNGYAGLVAGLGGDKKLAAAIAAPDDVPAHLQPFLATALNSSTCVTPDRRACGQYNTAWHFSDIPFELRSRPAARG